MVVSFEERSALQHNMSNRYAGTGTYLRVVNDILRSSAICMPMIKIGLIQTVNTYITILSEPRLTPSYLGFPLPK